MNTQPPTNARRLAVEKAQTAAARRNKAVEQTIKGRRDAQLCRAMGVGFVKAGA